MNPVVFIIVESHNFCSICDLNVTSFLALPRRTSLYWHQRSTCSPPSFWQFYKLFVGIDIVKLFTFKRSKKDLMYVNVSNMNDSCDGSKDMDIVRKFNVKSYTVYHG